MTTFTLNACPNPSHKRNKPTARQRGAITAPVRLQLAARTKQNIGRVQAYRILNKAAAEVGLIEIGTHTLRKTFGYHFYKRYKDVALLQEIFNHSAPSITLRYIGINQDIIDEAVGGFHL